MDWLFFSLISVFCFSFANMLRRILMKDDKTDAMASSIVFQFLGGIFIGILAGTQGYLFAIYQEYALNYLFVGLFWGLATFLQFKAYHYLEASEAVILSTLESVVIIVAARFFLSEFFTFPMLLGALCIVAGVILVAKTKKKLQFNRGIFYILGYCVFAGFGVINDTFMVKHVEPLSYLSIGFFLPAFFLMALSPRSLPQIKTVIAPAHIKKLFLLTLFYSAGSVLFIYAILYGAQVSQLGPISNSSIILTVLLATIFLGERDHLLRKVISTILVFIGVLLIR